MTRAERMHFIEGIDLSMYWINEDELGRTCSKYDE
jgi:hypothetical protein